MNQESGGREGNQYNANTTFKYDVIVFNARVASGGWVPRGQWDATAITPQCGRAPTGLSTRNPATSPPPPCTKPNGPPGRKPGATNKATEPQAPRAQT